MTVPSPPFPPSDTRMAGHLTLPFARGADRLELAFAPGGTAERADVAGYDFAEHRARYGAAPVPRYLVRARDAIPAATTLTITYDVPGATRTATVAVPGGTMAGASFLVPLPAGDRPSAVLRSLAGSRPAPRGTVADTWSITALLGELATLLWVLGAERDNLAAHAALLRGVRTLRRAAGRSLDLIGADMNVPRFPPLPYADEPGTVALYHLDEARGSDQVADAMTLYGGAGHPGTVAGASTGLPGRFGTAAGFGEPAGEIRVADHPDFALAAAGGLTAECMVRPDAGNWQGVVLSKHDDPADPARPGWAISVGAFDRGVPRNTRFLLSDGTHPATTLFADVSLDTTRFQHVAGVLDRSANRALLYVDGTLRASAPVAGLGALTTTAPLRIGRSGVGPAAAYHGAVDEVRISRMAHTTFHPVTGESDDGYRRRLAIFRRWTLPTPDGLQRVLNELAGRVHDIADPFVVDDGDAGSAAGSAAGTITPGEVPAGGSVDALGRRGRPEAEICGTADDDRAFDAAVLVTVPPGAALAYPGQPVGMRVGARRALRALLDRLAAAGIPGVLTVSSGHDPAASDLRAVGRALVFTHATLPAARLAALAQQAGFGWVRHLPGGTVYASVTSTEACEIRLDPPAAPPSPRYAADLLPGEIATLTLDPPPPPGAAVRWSIINSGQARAEFLDSAGVPVPPPWERAQARLRATLPGRLVVEVDVRRQGRTLTAGRELRIAPATLPAGRSIGGDGALDGTEPARDPSSDPAFGPAYVVTVDDPRLAAADVAARRMHPAAARLLGGLLDLLAADGATGLPRLTSAWKPGGTGLETIGRAITLDRGTSTATADRTGALAHLAGFDYVANTGAALRLAHRTGELVTVTGPAENAEAAATQYRVSPRALPGSAAAARNRLVVANSGTDTLSVLDGDGQVTRVVKVGWQPVSVAVSPDAATAYTADRNGATVTVVDLSTGAVTATVGLPARPVAVAHHPGARRVVVALTDRLVVINGATNAVEGSVALPAEPVALAVAPSGTDAWIALADGTLRSVALANLALAAPIALPGVPGGLAVTAARAYVTVPSQRALSVVDTGTRAVSTVSGIGAAPTAVAADPAAVYVADAAAGRVLLRRPDGAPPDPDRFASTIGVPVSLIPGGDRVLIVTRADDVRGGADAIGVLDPAPQRFAVTAFWSLGAGGGERLQWSLQPAAQAAARLDSTTTPLVTLRAQHAGPLLAVARYQRLDRLPFTVHIRLNPALEELERAGTPVVVRKEQYDLVMNALNELHPIGVEVDTRTLRAHVAELRAGLLDVFPAYTYPSYRLRGRPPGRPPREDI